MAEPVKADTVVEREVKDHVRWCKYSRRVALSTILGRGDRGVGIVGERVVVGGWVKSCKELRKEAEEVNLPPVAAPPVTNVTCSEVLLARVPFLRSITKLLVGPLVEKMEALPHTINAEPSLVCLRINDGSCVASIQIIIDSSVHPLAQVMPVGTAISVEGIINIKKPWTPGKHAIEITAEKVLYVGVVDTSKYPLTKTRLSFDYLRLHPHLRPRTTVIASIDRIRNGLTHSTHEFFKTNEFVLVHMPVISSTSAGDSSKTFQVMPPFGKSHPVDNVKNINDGDSITVESIRSAIREKSKRIEELKRSNSNREVLLSALDDLKNANELALQLEGHKRKNTVPTTKASQLDSSFFSHTVHLHRTAALHLESHACSLSNVYSLGPVFRAEKTHSKKDLAEMWMLDVNLAFSELEDVMTCAEDFLKFICPWILQNYSSDIKFISETVDKNCIHRLQSIGSSPFERLTYTEAIDALNKEHETSRETRIDWGPALSEEHERYLVDKIYKRPVIIYNHPKNLEPFFWRLNDDQKTVSSFDVIVPKAGVIIRGGQNEERFEVMSARIQESELPREQYEWYLDLRRHGTVKHAGFSIGLEHLVMFVTGVEDARDAIPFPRTHGRIKA